MKMRRPAPVPVRRPPVVQDDRMIDTGGFLDFYDRQRLPEEDVRPPIPFVPPFLGERGPGTVLVPPSMEDSGPVYETNPMMPDGMRLYDPRRRSGFEDGINPPPPPPQRSPGRPLPPGNIQDMLERMRDKFGRTPRRGPLPEKGPIFQVPRMPYPEPQPMPHAQREGGIGDLFRPYGSGLQDSPYGNLMDSIAEYGAGYNPYGQMGDYLMNRPVFDRGERPGSPMDMFRGPAAGGGGLFEEAMGQMQQQAPVIQQQYEDAQRQMEEQRQAAEAARAAEAEAKAAAQAEADAAMQARFDELNQRLADQEAAAAAREQEYRTSGESEREQLLARIAELEGAKPDLDAIRESIRADVMSNLPSQPSFDAEAIAQQVRDSMGLGDINLSDINERVAALQQTQADLAGKAQSAPQIDIDALRAQIQEGLDIPNIDVEEIQRRVQEGINVPNVDVEDLRRQVQEGIKVPNVDVDAIRQQLQSEFQVPDLGSIQERLAQVEGRGTALDPKVLERIQNLEQRGAPDLSGLESRIQELQGKIPQNIDVDAIKAQIQEGLNVPDLSGLQERLAQVEGRKGPDLSGLENRIKELQGKIPQQIDVDALRQQIQEGISVPQVDLSGLESQIKDLRGSIPQQVDVDALRQQIQEGLTVPDVSSLQDRLSELEGRGTAVDPAVLERLQQLEARKGPDLSGLQERLAAIENQRAYNDKAALTPAKGSGVDKKSIKDLASLIPIMGRGG